MKGVLHLSTKMLPANTWSTPLARQLQVQQVRHISKRRVAYPFYPFRKLGKQHPKKHDTNLKFAMRQFLGPKNFKGEYVYNKYYYLPQDHTPNYITPEIERGQALRDPVTGEGLALQTDGSLAPARGRTRENAISESRRLQPFPSNKHCKTNRILSEELKLAIHDDIQNKHLSTQEVSQKYGLKIPRIEAVVKLVSIEQNWEKHVCHSFEFSETIARARCRLLSHLYDELRKNRLVLKTISNG